MKIAILIYDGMTALDAVGPHEVLWRLPDTEIVRVAVRAGGYRTNSGIILNAEYSLSDISQADVLVVPGAKSCHPLYDWPEAIEWVRAIHATTTWTTSVCTGSLILGEAGILKGVKATTHWAVLDHLKEYGAIPTHERVVEDGKIMTGAGVSAGIDMALTLAAKIAGAQVAQSIQLTIEYDPKPPFDVGSPEKANTPLRQLLQTQIERTFTHAAP
ncbi:MAG: DJ-1/PfpI family protein [Chlamydiales bacterium]|nr:DJ-1/PfpI family protein [Chlamydiales bacterium]